MNVETLNVPTDVAHRMWKKYQLHKHNQSKVDADIERIYKAIAAGKLIVNALASIVKAGLSKEMLPKLAIARADAKILYLTNVSTTGACSMISDLRSKMSNTAKSRYVDFPSDSFPGIATDRWNRRALVPHIPPDIRPKRGLQNYHVLWEVEEWELVPPVDPMLLRQLGEDMWLVVGAWDLTPVERAVMEIHKPKEPR